MAARKTPVLLRRGPVSGNIQALTRYTRRVEAGTIKGKKREILRAATDGKHDVTADFDALVLENLLDGDGAAHNAWPASPDIIAILDGVADDDVITAEQRAQVRGFRERLKLQIERHNTQGHGRRTPAPIKRADA